MSGQLIQSAEDHFYLEYPNRRIRDFDFGQHPGCESQLATGILHTVYSLPYIGLSLILTRALDLHDDCFCYFFAILHYQPFPQIFSISTEWETFNQNDSFST